MKFEVTDQFEVKYLIYEEVLSLRVLWEKSAYNFRTGNRSRDYSMRLSLVLMATPMPGYRNNAAVAWLFRWLAILTPAVSAFANVEIFFRNPGHEFCDIPSTLRFLLNSATRLDSIYWDKRRPFPRLLLAKQELPNWMLKKLNLILQRPRSWSRVVPWPDWRFR